MQDSHELLIGVLVMAGHRLHSVQVVRTPDLLFFLRYRRFLCSWVILLRIVFIQRCPVALHTEMSQFFLCVLAFCQAFLTVLSQCRFLVRIHFDMLRPDGFLGNKHLHLHNTKWDGEAGCGHGFLYLVARRNFV